jgi:hypothetical protein
VKIEKANTIHRDYLKKKIGISLPREEKEKGYFVREIIQQKDEL